MAADFNESAQDAHSHPLVWRVFVGFVFGLVLGAAFQSQALVTLSYDLEPGPMANRVVLVAETWHGMMQQLGLPTVSETISEHLETFRTRPVGSSD
ncbi:MAG: hypothetical protein AAGI12_13105 [Pseudomonadota bacterium]